MLRTLYRNLCITRSDIYDRKATTRLELRELWKVAGRRWLKKITQEQNNLYHAGFAAARTAVLAFRDVVIPALAMLTVCCSITSWIAVRSNSSILSNSSMAHIPISASTCIPSLQLWLTLRTTIPSKTPLRSNWTKQLFVIRIMIQLFSNSSFWLQFRMTEIYLLFILVHVATI